MVNFVEFKLNDTIINIKNNKKGYINKIFNNDLSSFEKKLYGIIYFDNNEYEIVDSLDIKHYIFLNELI